MPIIAIKTLLKPADIAQSLQQISEQFSQASEIDLQHISMTWETFSADHYLVGGQLETTSDRHPILVQLITPDFQNDDQTADMLNALAQSISSSLNWPLNRIFITHHPVSSGHVFDQGKIMHW